MSQYEEDWFGPKTGLLAADVPLPPRRPSDLGQRDALQRFYNNPSDLPGPRVMPSQPKQPPSPTDYDEYLAETGRERFNELKRDYPYGAGLPETSPSFGRPVGQFSTGQINKIIGGQGRPGEIEDIYAGPKGPMPPEFEPERPIPLGEIQRRWGVPRLEDL